MPILRHLLPFVLWLPGLCAQETPSPWLTDHAAAVARAKAEQKPILADFTGSDWCGWCVKLKQEVFDTDAFRTWAATKVVLLELDFPRRTEQAEDLKRQNENLARRYRITGYPTILLLDAEGNRLGQLGYQPGGPAAWTQAADALLAGKGATGPASGVAAAIADAASEGWTADLAAAQKLAETQGRPILAAFTGSDWCRKSQALRSGVFADAAFRSWAREQVVLLEVDFPRRGKQSPALKQQNAALAERLAVLGYPAVLLLDAKGQQLAVLPADAADAAAFVAAAKQALENRGGKGPRSAAGE